MTPILDPQIRSALIAHLRQSDPAAVIFEELPLGRGERRADVVAVNGVIAGYEIKSERDSLAKLTGQADRYADVCEYMTAVVAHRHLARARAAIPSRWGLVVAERGEAGVRLRHVRRPKRNAQLDKFALIRLMWKTECVRAMRARGIPADRKAGVRELWHAMEQLPTRHLCEDVRSALKARRVPESGLPRTPNGG